MKDKENITLGSLFDGIGGFPYAASFYGIETLWTSEIIPDAISVTRRHFPDIEHVGDITKLKGRELEPVDIITFGSPCQSFSIAGKRTGLAGKSGLFWEAIRIIREMREATNGEYPKYCVFENVPGILSANKGRDYKSVLEAFAETEVPLPPSGKWTNAGMVRGGAADVAWIMHDAQHFGVAQRRRRLFAVCDFTGQRAAEILFKPKSLHRHFTQGRAPGKGFAANAPGSVDSAESNCINTVAAFMGGQSCEADEKISPTLRADSGSNMVHCICEPQSCVTVVNDQGGDSLTIEKTDLSPTLRSEAHGNLPIVSIDNSKNKCNTLCTVQGMENYCLGYTNGDANLALGINQNIDSDVRRSETACTLTISSNASCRNAPLVCHPEVGNEVNRRILQEPHTFTHLGHGHHKQSDVGKTLLNNIKCDSSDVVAYCLQGSMIGRKDKNGPNGNAVNEDVSYTLNTTDRHAVFSRQRSDEFQSNNVASTQTARQSKDVTDFVVDASSVDCRNLHENKEKSGTLNSKNTVGYSLNYQNPIRCSLTVRRLTPVECERLQGYPDSWTEYGHDGKALSDTARYQALGNSVAIPCVAYVLSGIVDEFQNK